MKVAPTLVDLDLLMGEVQSLEYVKIPDGSGHETHGGVKGWINGCSQFRLCGPGRPDVLDQYPALYAAVCEIAEFNGNALVQAMVNRLEAGAKLDRHRDGLPDNYRYHLPIITHPDVEWWDERFGARHMTLGVWYGPVPYCGILHSVTNRSDIDRYHLMVDFAKA